mmetsp:Transcript_20476/g.44351  ORF Transcript_20476/g.44351 Transcript_20476/m.44351 type:complete len:95 (-) Transcript_20476:53-337(-)
MFRRSAIVMANQARRTIVRDPRKKSVPAVSTQLPAAAAAAESHPVQQQAPQQQPLPFEPSQQNQESVGSSLVSYAVAGVGVALGVTLVRVIVGF